MNAVPVNTRRGTGFTLRPAGKLEKQLITPIIISAERHVG
jgi:hypothetical protein